MPPRLTSLKSVSLLTATSLITLLVQFAYQLLLARYFGSSREMDAYGAALTPPTVLSGLLTGALGYAFLPQFIECRQRQGDAAAWRLAGSLGWSLLIALVALAAGGMFAARPIIRMLYPGFSPAELELTSQIFRWLVWMLVCNSLIAYLQALHHAQQSFLVPALASIVGTGCTLVWTWFRASSGGIVTVAEGVVWGSVIAVACQAPLFLRHAPLAIALNDNLRRTVALTLPLLIGGLFKFEPQVDRYFASAMPEGTIAHLGYSKAVIQALLILATSSLSIVLFPVIASLAAQQRLDDLRNELTRAMQFLALLVIPLGAGLYFFGEPLVAALLERGMFTADDTRAVALLVVLQIGVIAGGGFGDVFAKAFYAFSDTRTPLIVGISGFGLVILLKLWWHDRFGAAGLVAATSINLVFMAAVMACILSRRLGQFVNRDLLITCIRAALGAAAGVAIGWPIWQHAGRLSLVWAALAGSAAYLIVLLILREPLAAELRHVRWLRRRREELATPVNSVLAADPAGDRAPHSVEDVLTDGRPLGT